MPSSIKNVMIGIFVISAIAVVIFMLLFLHPSVGDNAKTLRVRFTDIDKVNVGTRVTFAGKAVGEVSSIKELPEVRTSRTSKNGDIYVYELVLKVDSSVEVFNTDQIILRTSGLLGERNIEINPLPLKPGETLINVEKDILYADQTTSVEDTMKDIANLSSKFEKVLDDFHAILTDIQDEQVVKKISGIAQNVLDISQTLNQPEKWGEILDNTLTLTRRANDTWTTVDETVNEFHLTSKNAVAFTDKANEIIDLTRRGKGTLGKLFVDEDLYLRLKSILHRGEIIADDINHYGILFHSNKRWQRLQANRLRLLEKLSSPIAFANYFNDEMDQITASLSRVTCVLNQSDCYPKSLIYNQDFTKRFSELLRRVENMEESLKMYNEQVISQE